MSGDAN
jgi:hypothetical protein